MEDESKLSIEEVARRRFQKAQERAKKVDLERSSSFTSDANVSRHDFEETISVLSKRLQLLQGDARKAELKELVERVQRDLNEAKERLRNLK
jgi:hypothetical protein